MEGLVKVFVYGTLKRGFANCHLMQNGLNGVTRFVTTGLTKEAFPLVIGTDASIPFMLPLKGQGKQVHGEIYEVDNNVLRVLDELEGHPTWYKRTQCEITTTDKTTGIEAGDVILCSAYFLTDFSKEFLLLDFIGEYTQEHHKAHVKSSDRNSHCDVRGQSQHK